MTLSDPDPGFKVTVVLKGELRQESFILPVGCWTYNAFIQMIVEAFPCMDIVAWLVI